MDCATAQAILLRLQRGKLNKRITQRVSHHVEVCPRCRHVHDAFHMFERREPV